jgi:hypothetical protein
VPAGVLHQRHVRRHAHELTPTGGASGADAGRTRAGPAAPACVGAGRRGRRCSPRAPTAGSRRAAGAPASSKRSLAAGDVRVLVSRGEVRHQASTSTSPESASVCAASSSCSVSAPAASCPCRP